jgi:ring-1,2-phenylacetyl-CoA epoxidase subunit PaaD
MNIAVARLWQALQQVKDPELPVLNIVEIGIVRAVTHSDQGITVTITPTFAACPALYAIREAIVAALAGFAEPITVKTQLAPPWSSDWITPAAKIKLEHYGIAPPLLTKTTTDQLITLEPAAIRCPRCYSFAVERKNRFGSALCKMIYQCQSCHEPFEAMKSI